MNPLTGAVLAAEIRALLACEISWEDFWDWMRDAMLRPHAPDVRPLYWQLIGRTDEYDRGDWTDEQLATFLRDIVARSAALGDQ
ncbi:MAG TPA: hypothetical protein VFL91_15240 [Thermomicrobiales bacterium]|nr:hypothetical protein [Thermomicrobiales bacterium]